MVATPHAATPAPPDAYMTSTPPVAAVALADAPSLFAAPVAASPVAAASVAAASVAFAPVTSAHPVTVTM
jgi:hypothetical protein